MSKIDPRASLAIFAVVSVILVGLFGLAYKRFTGRDSLTRPEYSGAGDPAPVGGKLSVSVFPDGTSGLGKPSELQHETVFVNGPHYRGMEDNDLRGYLDGGYKYRWNQPGQVHLRIGRRRRGSSRGEFELFRNIQRWADIELPPGSQVTSANLQIFVEGGSPGYIDVFLYELKKDYDPGRGGVEENNTSTPKQGEVWWGERAADVEPRWPRHTRPPD